MCIKLAMCRKRSNHAVSTYVRTYYSILNQIKARYLKLKKLDFSTFIYSDTTLKLHFPWTRSKGRTVLQKTGPINSSKRSWIFTSACIVPSFFRNEKWLEISGRERTTSSITATRHSKCRLILSCKPSGVSGRLCFG